MQKLADQNLAEREPSRSSSSGIFHSHPSIGKRIAADQSWAGSNRKPQRLASTGSRLVYPVVRVVGAFSRGPQPRRRCAGWGGQARVQGQE